ncbi:hypothetical protein K435DRAFT_608231, partial [Dendrothele bispora CBS 962.96]
LIKSANKLIAKRELSGQQIASKLIGTPNHYTNRSFPVFYWSEMLQIEQDSFVFLTKKTITCQEFQDGVSSSMTNHTSLFNDIFYRPPELSDVCAWDQMCNYSKEECPQSKNPIKTYLRFKPGHPQYSTYCLKKIKDTETSRIPALKGYSIPRSDRGEQEQQYIVAMLALFKPWSTNEQNPLKSSEDSWQDVFDTWKTTNHFQDHKHILENMQLLYETKDAKLDYSA